MGDVVPIRRCGRCGAPARKRTVFFDGKEVAEFDACDLCVSQTNEKLGEERKIFLALLDFGVDRETANAMMIAKHAHEDEHGKG